MQPLKTLRCTISGSFRKNLPAIRAKVEECSQIGVTVLSPRSMDVVGEDRGFVYFRGDRGDPGKIESRHLEAISQSDFLYVVNPGGYVGTSVSLEIGWAVAYSVPVYCSEESTEAVLSSFSRVEPRVTEVRRNLAAKVSLEIPRNASLPMLQSYIDRVVRARGFEEETLRDVTLLLVEEVGELAKAIRREIGLQVNEIHSKGAKTIGHELADCLIYLLDIANLAGVNLDEAFSEKEAINWKKKWVSVVHPQNIQADISLAEEKS